METWSANRTAPLTYPNQSRWPKPTHQTNSLASAAVARASNRTLPPRRGGLLHADIDGDGFSDTVSVRYALNAPSSCGFLLVVETRRGAFAVRVPESYKTPDMPVREWPWREPFVAAVVGLGGHRSQVVLAREEGASVVNVSLYGITRGKLKRLHFHPAVHQDEVSLFGTVGTGSTNVYCRRGGPMIVLGVAPTSATGKRFAFSKSTYRLGRYGFALTGTRTTIGTAAQVWALADRSSFDSLPFTGCTLARGRRL
jgi:hypothetical protein